MMTRSRRKELTRIQNTVEVSAMDETKRVALLVTDKNRRLQA